MKTLILNGSPRAQGNTAQLVELLLSRLYGEVCRIDAYSCDISPCVDCRYCQKNDGCAISDGMSEIYGCLDDCDNVLIASPIYFFTLSGKLLNLASRFQVYYSTWHFRGKSLALKPKRGAVILTCGGSGGIENASKSARIILRQINCKEIYPVVFSKNTDEISAINDKYAVLGTEKIAEFFNRR